MFNACGKSENCRSPENCTRTSHPEVFFKKGVLTNFAKFTGKHLGQNLFFNRVAGLRPETLLKRESVTGVFL